MPARTELDRLDEARLLVLDRTEAIVNADEEHLILVRILESNPVLVDKPASTRQSSARLLLRAVGGAAAAAIFIAAVLGLAIEGVHSPSAPHDHVSASGRSQSPHGPRMKVADYTFELPKGFTTTSSECAPIPSGPGPATPVPVLAQFGAAASAEGGCIEALLSTQSSVTIPPGAEAVDVGTYQGFLASSDPSKEALYISIPADEGPPQYLMLMSQGLTSEQLLAIAESALPSTLSPSPAG
jgi:hypothetical protein